MVFWKQSWVLNSIIQFLSVLTTFVILESEGHGPDIIMHRLVVYYNHYWFRPCHSLHIWSFLGCFLPLCLPVASWSVAPFANFDSRTVSLLISSIYSLVDLDRHSVCPVWAHHPCTHLLHITAGCSHFPYAGRHPSFTQASTCSHTCPLVTVQHSIR